MMRDFVFPSSLFENPQNDPRPKPKPAQDIGGYKKLDREDVRRVVNEK